LAFEAGFGGYIVFAENPGPGQIADDKADLLSARLRSVVQPAGTLKILLFRTCSASEREHPRDYAPEEDWLGSVPVLERL
jgi:hypothetical protein